MDIVEDDLSGEAVRSLINEHLDDMAATSPPGSCHALAIDELRAPDVTFWSAWSCDELLGFGALKELDPRHGEIKSMRTVKKHLGRGVGSEVLQYIIGESRKRGYGRLSLETGSGEPFEASHALYRKFGFVYCEPFGDYRHDPFSRFMTLQID